MSIIPTIDEMLAELPDESECEPGATAPEMPVMATSRLMSAFGWPDRYLEPLDSPEGVEWLSALSVANAIIGSGGILILHGKRGTGKTQLAAEVARSKRFPFDAGTKADPKRSAHYQTAMRFFLTVRATFKKGSDKTELDIIDRMTEPGLLVIDELQERGETAFEDRLLTHLIDARYGARRPTILIANLRRDELGKALGPSIVDRVHENGKSIDFTWNSYRRA
jgi:DNA replication protein DnaC